MEQIIQKQFYRPLQMLIACMVFIAVPATGQVGGQRQLLPSDYKLWGTLWPQKVSEEGNWTSYVLRYESHKDTLFVKRTLQNITYSYPKGREGCFNGESKFACLVSDTLIVTDLSSGMRRKIPNVSSYFFTENKNFMVYYKQSNDGNMVLETEDLNKGVTATYGIISTWIVHPSGNAMVFCGKSEGGYAVRTITFGKDTSIETIVKDSVNRFQNPVWRGNTIAFTMQNESPDLYCYRLKHKKLTKYKNPAKLKISSAYGTLFIAADEQKIFFMIKDEVVKSVEDSKTVEVWNTSDRQLFPNKEKFGDAKLRDKLAAWNVADNSTVRITDGEFHSAFLTADSKYALVFKECAEPSNGEQNGRRDVYIMDLNSHNKKIFLKSHSGDILSVINSPGGKYIAYVLDTNWWIYDIDKQTHCNITATVPVAFFDEDHNKPSQPLMYGNPGWEGNDAAILLYDKYDLWALSPDGKKSRRLTHGREKKLSFRVAPQGKGQQPNYSFFECTSGRFNLNSKLIFKVYDYQKATTAYCSWDIRKGVEMVTDMQMKSSHLFKALNSNVYIFMEQNYETSPRLLSNRMGEKSILFQSNPQQGDFKWGRAEKISYWYKGKELSAALFYPAGFEPGRHYPMIVQVYERQSHYVNNYINPSVFEQGGFNITNYTSEGYFVLLPDLIYDYGNTGKSATDCTLAAIDQVVAQGYVDARRIGLIGHSFGGYETDYIITQTNRFAAAVAGAAWTDLTSAYLYIGKSFLTADYWRAEEDQLRIGRSLFEDSSAYFRNSPVLNAANVTTPLLGWAGKNDETIDPNQSIEFYLALRRLGKKHILLLYPGEDHVLLNPKAQEDLTLRTRKWFAHYLNDGEAPEWSTSK